MEKYILTDETKVHFGVTLHRIKATVDFTLKYCVKISAGDLGGWVEKKENLDDSGNAWVYGDALVYGDAQVYGNAQVYGDAQVCGDAKVYGNAQVYGNALVCDNAQVYGDAQVCGDALVCDNAQVCDNAHYMCVGPLGSRGGYTTFFRTAKLEISVSCGCFRGTIAEFRAKVKGRHGDSKFAKEYALAADLAEMHIGLSE